MYSFASESLYFWLDVENYQNLPLGGEYMARAAMKIYQKYIVDNVISFNVVIIIAINNAYAHIIESFAD